MNDRVLLHVRDGLRRVVDIDDVYYLEAAGDATRVRLRSAKVLLDVRRLGDLLPAFEPRGFLRIHREYAVNLRRVREIRRRDRGRDWEVKLEPPVNRVLPVSRGKLGSSLGFDTECQGRETLIRPFRLSRRALAQHSD